MSTFLGPCLETGDRLTPALRKRMRGGYAEETGALRDVYKFAKRRGRGTQQCGQGGAGEMVRGLQHGPLQARMGVELRRQVGARRSRVLNAY